MPVTTRTPPPPTLLQRFRTYTEGLLIEVAQEEILRQYPDAGVQPRRKSGWVYTLLRLLFLPGYRLTPRPLRRRLMRLLFVRSPQHWSNTPRWH